MSDQLIFTEEADRPEKKGGRLVIALILFLLILAGAGYAWAWSQAKDRIPRGTTIEGVDVGGLTQAQAVEELESELAERAESPMDVTLASTTTSLTPARAGLAVDYEASVDEVGAERSLDPVWLWDYFTGGDDVSAVLDLDDEALEQELASVAEDVEREPVDGAIEFRTGGAVVTQSETGLTLDMDDSRELVQSAYLSDEVPELPLRSAEPEITDDELLRAQRQLANPAVSGPITLTMGKGQARLRPEQYLPAVSIVQRQGELAMKVNQKKLKQIVDKTATGMGSPRDAQVVLRGGSPTVIPAKTGISYRQQPLVQAFRRAVTGEGKGRTRNVATRKAQPDFTTKDARDLGVKTRVSSFTTYYPYAEYRNVNLGRAAELIDGTLLKPGETFSLNGIVGERTRENGFTDGYIISNGILTGDLGGGVSQIATTTFNAMYFAGLKDVEHKPHSFYIDRYPIGREATVAWGAIDLRFKNDTPHGVLVQANVTPATSGTSGEVTVSMYSTKRWDITSRTGDRYNFTQPQVRQIDDLECHPNQGFGGFDINVWRDFRRHNSDELVRSEKMHTTYTPSDTVECTNPNYVDPIS